MQMDKPLAQSLLVAVRPPDAAGPQSRPGAKPAPRRRTRSPRCELLEPRTLLSLVAADLQFQVNRSTPATPRAPVAVDADGNFVVVWMDGIRGVYGRRYDAANDPLGDQFVIASGDKPLWEPRVAMDADGDFVVVWTPQTS